MPRTPDLPKLTPFADVLRGESDNHITYCVRPADMFKTVTLRVVLSVPLSARHASANAIIPGVLRMGCNAWPRMSVISERLDELWGAGLRQQASNAGRRQLLSLSLNMPAPGYLPGGMKTFRAGVDLVRQILLDPVVEKGGFARSHFATRQQQILRSFETLQDNRQRYAAWRAGLLTFEGTPQGVYHLGTPRDVAALDPQDVYRRYRKLLRTASMAVWLSGPVSPKKHLPVVMEAFADLQRSKPTRMPRNRPLRPANVGLDGQKPRRRRDTLPMEQTIVVLSYATGINFRSRDHAALLYANGILGALSTSRLFRVVREEHGLAYAAQSYVGETSGTCFMWAATDPADAAKARTLMVRQLADLQQHGCDDDEFDAARNSLLEDHLSEQDSPGARISDLIVRETCDAPATPDEQLEALKAVTPARVRAVLRRFKPILDYRLGPATKGRRG